jgi:hypothetical protein
MSPYLGKLFLDYLEFGSSTLLRNVLTFLPIHMPSNPWLRVFTAFIFVIILLELPCKWKKSFYEPSGRDISSQGYVLP